MEKFSRVLAVLIAVVSVAFMGFAGAISFGGPNWEAEALAMKDYTFTYTGGENPTWSATRAVDGQALNVTSPVLAAVLAAAYQDRARVATEESTRLADDTEKLKVTTEGWKSRQAADIPALQNYLQLQSQRLAETESQIQMAAAQREELAGEVSQVDEELASRREEVFRLELEHRVLTADVERIKQNITTVEEQIRLLEDELDKTERRSRELDSRGIPSAL